MMIPCLKDLEENIGVSDCYEAALLYLTTDAQLAAVGMHFHDMRGDFNVALPSKHGSRHGS